MKKVFFFFVFLCLNSCAGYHFKSNKNPLAQFGIHSISVPMFLNQSAIPDVSGPFAKEVRLLLQRFPGLKVWAGDCSGADACLLGIVKSPKGLVETVIPTQFDISTKMAKGATLPRADYFIPITSNIKLNLHLVLVKAPSEAEVDLFNSSLGDEIQLHPKMVFNKIIPVEWGFNREVFDRDPKINSDGVVVNMTQNVGSQGRTVKQMAKIAAISFKELVLDAF